MKEIKTNDTWLEMEKLVNVTVKHYRSDFFTLDYDTLYPLKDGTEFFFCVRDAGTDIILLGYTPELMERQAQYFDSLNKSWKIDTWYLIRKNVSITPMTYEQVIAYMSRKLKDVYNDTVKRVRDYNNRMMKEGKYINSITYKEAGISDIILF